MEVNLGEEVLCAACVRGDNYFSRVRSVFVYDEASKELILKFKHGDAHYGAPIFARWMVQAQKGILKPGYILTPVPLHWGRLFRRSYNQSQILAKEIYKIKPELQYKPSLLQRIRATPSQGQFNREQRYKNIKGSIKVSENKKKLIKGKYVVLIDDVLTSGATLNVCAQVLLKAGVAGVNGLTLGRVTRT